MTHRPLPSLPSSPSLSPRAWAALLAAVLAGAAGIVPLAHAQDPGTATTPAAATTAVVPPQATADGKLGFSLEGVTVPPFEHRNANAPRTVQLLGEALARASGPTRAAYAIEVGRCKLPQGLPLLDPAVADPDPHVRAAAARAIGTIGDPSGAATLAPLVGDAEAVVRAEAVRAAAALGDDAAVAKGLADDDVTVVKAALSVARPGHADAVAALLPNLAPSAQPLAAAALGRVGAAEKHAAAVVPLLSGDVVQKTAAADALGHMKATAQAQAVGQLLADPHPRVRRAAVEAGAGVLADGPRQQMAIRMLGDADPTVREAAANLLADVPTPDAIAPLVSQLGHAYTPLYLAAREALVKAGPLAIDVAAKLLDHADPRRREDGSYVLGELKSDANLERHIALVKDADWGVVRQVAWSLGLIGRTEAVEPLAELAARGPTIHETAGDAGQVAVQAVANAIVSAARFRHAPTLPAVSDLFKDRPSMMDPGRPANVRAAAVYLFGVVGDASDAERCQDMLSKYNNMFEAPTVKLEALKALGHVNYAPAADSLRKYAGEEPTPDLRFMAHWAYQQISGEQIPYQPPVVNWRADVSIVDTSEEGQ